MEALLLQTIYVDIWNASNCCYYYCYNFIPQRKFRTSPTFNFSSQY